MATPVAFVRWRIVGRRLAHKRERVACSVRVCASTHRHAAPGAQTRMPGSRAAGSVACRGMPGWPRRSSCCRRTTSGRTSPRCSRRCARSCRQPTSSSSTTTAPTARPSSSRSWPPSSARSSCCGGPASRASAAPTGRASPSPSTRATTSSSRWTSTCPTTRPPLPRPPGPRRHRCRRRHRVALRARRRHRRLAAAPPPAVALGQPLHVARARPAGPRLHVGLPRLPRRAPCARIAPQTTSAEGYAFLTELVRRLVRAGCRVMETPIVFRDRRFGESKMSGRIVAESMAAGHPLGPARPRRPPSRRGA